MKTVFHQEPLWKILWSIIFDGKMNLSTNSIGKSYFLLRISIISSKHLVRNFLWLQNHFLENNFPPKLCMKNILVENFVGNMIRSWNNICKSYLFSRISVISSWDLVRKVFYSCKIISLKTVFHKKKITWKIFSLQLVIENHISY